MTRGVIKRGRKLKKKLGQVLANPSVYPLLPWLIILSALLVSTRSKAQNKFDNTTTGIESSQNELTQADLDALDKTTQQQILRFKKGRQSSAESSDSRYSGTLELHDANYDGVSDHGNSRNTLEGGLEKAAIGVDGLPDDDNRKNKLTKAKQASQESALGRKCTIANPCNDGPGTSANIVDVGPAHDRDDPKNGNFVEHRVYDITEKAKNAAENSGNVYGEQVLKEAAIYKFTDKSRVRPTNEQNKIQVLVNNKGKGEWVTQEVTPELDLIRSEVSWLEDQKELHLQNEWKLRRASRLAGDALGSDSEIAETVASIYKKSSGKNTQKEDQKLASVIADPRIASTTEICVDAQKTPRKCSQGETPIPAQEFARTNKLDAKQRAEFFSKVSKLASSNPGYQKQRNEQISKLTRCFGIDANCDNSLEELSQKSNRTKDYVYSDSREYIYNRMQKENQGSLNSMGKNISNADFNASIDSKAKNSKIYQSYMNQIQENQKAWQQFIAEEKAKEKEYPGYKSPYSLADANKMSAKELFKINAAKYDNRTLMIPVPVPTPRGGGATRAPTSSGNRVVP
jgi:hypothetical protein